MQFYEKYVEFCNKNGLTPCGAAEKMGLAKSATTRWANGSEPNYSTKKKIADFFGVSVEVFAEKEKATAPKSDGLTDMQRQAMALIPKISDEDLELLISALRIASERKG